MSSILTVAGLVERSASEAVGFGLGTALGAALGPEADQLAQDSWHLDPTRVLEPQVLALLVRLGYLDEPTAADQAQYSGFDSIRFGQLVQALSLPPGTGELVELHRRGELDDAALQEWLRRGGISPELVPQLATLSRVHLAPADAAMARVQSFLTQQQQYDYAALAGYSNADAELQYLISGLPPGIGEGLELLRRGEIDEARFAEYVLQGHTKPQYLPDLLALKRVILSPAVYAEALVRNRLTETEAVAGAAKSGLERDDFLLWSHMLGRPPGIMEALTLLNRGIPYPADSPEALAWFTDVVARSDVRTEYAPALYNLRVHFPSLFQMERLISNNAISDDYARTIFSYEGYPAQLIDGLIANGHKTKAATNHHLALSVVETAYDAGLETHDQALAAVESLGYAPADAAQLLDLHEARRILAELYHGVTVVRGRYTGWKIDEATARAELVALQLSPLAIDQRLSYWQAEREANRPALTTAEIAAAFHYSRYDFPTAQQLLMGLGWSEDDALTILWVRTHGDPRV